jgi:hypothetical protein
MSHKFSIGQKVDLVHRILLTAPRGQYEVRRLMPESDRDAGDPIYRIKSNEENHERVVQESDLTASRVTEMAL